MTSKSEVKLLLFHQVRRKKKKKKKQRKKEKISENKSKQNSPTQKQSKYKHFLSFFDA